MTKEIWHVLPNTKGGFDIDREIGGERYNLATVSEEEDADMIGRVPDMIAALAAIQDWRDTYAWTDDRQWEILDAAVAEVDRVMDGLPRPKPDIRRAATLAIDYLKNQKHEGKALALLLEQALIGLTSGRN